MTVITIPHVSAPHPNIRRFDVFRDLNAVADLIELCFSGTLDADGNRYIRQMRKSAKNPQLTRWASNVGDWDRSPLAGFVWEEHGRVVGNLSMVRAREKSRKSYLIANVAVHPDFRRQGIARALTDAAIKRARQRNAGAIWLHAREDNPAATHLYGSIGFAEQTRRTTWRVGPGTRQTPAAPAGVRVRARRGQHWERQRDWFNHLHPPQIAWYLPLDMKAMRPGLVGAIYRLASGKASPKHWVAERDGLLLGALSWQRTYTYADKLWLATPKQHEDAAALALAAHARRHTPKTRSLDLEYPVGRAAEAFRMAGFRLHQTLLWMEMALA